MADLLPPEIILIIRFTTSLPDLPLPIHNPKTTTTLSLKQLIRPHLPATQSSSRLRLIHSGKVLADTAPLSTSLNLPPPPPPRSKPPDNDAAKSKAKGKERAADTDDAAPQPKRVYIHCSIGDALTPSALAAEATAAANAEAALEAAFSQSQSQVQSRPSTSAGAASALDGASGATTASLSTATTAATATSSTSAAPQGFDRLLTAGFTAAEVASLRSQFRANLAFTHTPDAMPSVAEQRVLEDRWLDNDGGGGGSALGGGGGGGGGGGQGTGGADGGTGAGDGGGWGAAGWADDSGLDDMLYGNVVGFFWPLGALGWGFREEGVWSRRRQIAVLTGFLLNVIFGFLRMSS